MGRPAFLRCPYGLGERAEKHWKHYASKLFAAGTLTPETVEPFKNLCRLLAVADQASAEIEQKGVVITGPPGGASKANPAVAILISAQRQAAPMLSAFGLDEH